MKTIPILISLLFSLLAFSSEKSPTYNIWNKKLVDGVIWGMDFLDKEKIIFTVKSGKIFILNVKSKKLEEVSHEIESTVHGQGGLLDIMYDGTNIYATYAKKLSNGNVTTALFKGELTENILKGKDLFVANTSSNKGQHFGSRVVKMGEALFMSVGDRGHRDEAQKLSNHHGKILRMTTEGKPYPNNPFKESPYIFSYGHRNPQGLAVDRENKILYEVEFGPKGGDEFNIISEGKNYGWPVITYGREYWGPKIGQTTKQGMEQPLHYWVPSISPSGMMLYQHDKFKVWKGEFFLANLSSRHLRKLTLNKMKVQKEVSYLEDLNTRMRVVKQSPTGDIYIGTDSGNLIRLY